MKYSALEKRHLTAYQDPVPTKIEMVQVEPNLKVEVLQFGGVENRRADQGNLFADHRWRSTLYRIPSPLLAIMACPHKLTWPPDEPAQKRSTRTRLDFESCSEEEKVLRRAEPTAHIVLSPDAFHTLFLDRPQDVAREMDTFIEELPHSK